MKRSNDSYRILWKKTADGNAKILRIFSSIPTMKIPNQLAGIPVTEIGNYCFAPTCQLPEEYLTTESDNLTAVTDLCGSFLKSILLPDTLTKIGDYSFYNCRKLSDVTFPGGALTIGSDTFMNCHSLHKLQIKCSAFEKSSLRQILAQISWDAEVTFLGSNKHNLQQVSAVIFYPEYYEAYNEITPAHIFGRRIVGEGFRARQSFQNDIVDFSQYDSIFPKACQEESEQTLCRLAFDRLLYPYHLADASKIRYANYILAHGQTLCRQLIHDKQLEALLFLLNENLLSQQDIEHTLTFAVQSGWSEGAAAILHWKQKNISQQTHTRYTFEDW